MYLPPGLAYTAETVAQLAPSKGDTLDSVAMYYDVATDALWGGILDTWNVSQGRR